MIHEYFYEIHSLLHHIEDQEYDKMMKAAQAVSETLQNEGVVHLFGCGHSHILTEEVYYRAGGLVPIHPILHEPLMLHKGALRSSEFERKNGYAETFMYDQDIREGDVIFVISTSGRNPVPVDAALIAKEKGATVIVMTSKTYSASQSSRHKDGLHLYDVGDIVIDNHAPPGDALLSHDRMDIKFAPSSTVVGATMINSILAKAIEIITDSGHEPPVLLSGNIDGADEHNQKLIEKYQGRINL